MKLQIENFNESVQEVAKEYDTILEQMKGSIEEQTEVVQERIIEITALKNQRRNPSEKAANYSDEFF